MEHWNKMKIPNAGLSDGMVAFLKTGKIKPSIVKAFLEMKQEEAAKPISDWSWDSYNESVKKRAEKLERNSVANLNFPSNP